MTKHYLTEALVVGSVLSLELHVCHLLELQLAFDFLLQQFGLVKDGEGDLCLEGFQLLRLPLLILLEALVESPGFIHCGFEALVHLLEHLA